MGLWEDISLLDRQEIELTLDELLAKPAKKKNAQAAGKSPKKKGARLLDDRPATIIVHQLSVLADLDDQAAKAKLASALTARGIPNLQIPPLKDEPLRAWVDKLIEKVPSTLVSAEAAKFSSLK